MGLGTPCKLPVIDLSTENLKKSWSSTCDQVRRAFEEYGVFIGIYPKVSAEMDETVFGLMKDLFALPGETKIQNTNVKPLHGYLGMKPPLPSIHESLGIEHAETQEGIQSFTNLMWPAGNDAFCKNVQAYAKQLTELDGMVKRMVFESYGLGKREADEFLGSTNYLLRLIKYRVPEEGESNLGAHCHTDKGVITIIHQEAVDGLEIKTRDGEWILHQHIPSAFVIFAGDAFMAWSNGRIHSPQHQVVIRGEVTRYALGLFTFNNGIIQVPKELVDEEHPLQFKPFSNYGLLNFFISDHDLSRKEAPCVQDYCGV